MKTLPQFDLNINFFCPFTTFDEVRTSCFDLIWIHSIELRQRWLERVSHQYHQSFVPLDFLCSPISQKKHCASMMEAIALLSILTNAGTDAIWRPRPTHCQWLRRGNLCISAGPLHKMILSWSQWLFAANTYKNCVFTKIVSVFYIFSGHLNQVFPLPGMLTRPVTGPAGSTKVKLSPSHHFTEFWQAFALKMISWFSQFLNQFDFYPLQFSLPEALTKQVIKSAAKMKVWRRMARN